MYGEKSRFQLIPDVAADTPIVQSADRLETRHLPELGVRPSDEAERRERRHELRELHTHLGKVLHHAQDGPDKVKSISDNLTQVLVGRRNVTLADCQCSRGVLQKRILVIS